MERVLEPFYVPIQIFNWPIVIKDISGVVRHLLDTREGSWCLSWGRGRRELGEGLSNALLRCFIQSPIILHNNIGSRFKIPVKDGILNIWYFTREIYSKEY